MLSTVLVVAAVVTLWVLVVKFLYAIKGPRTEAEERSLGEYRKRLRP